MMIMVIMMVTKNNTYEKDNNDKTVTSKKNMVIMMVTKNNTYGKDNNDKTITSKKNMTIYHQKDHD